jgi:hypothetical protein
MSKSVVSLTRLQNPDDVMYWSRQLVDELQRIFLGSGAGFIDGDSILDGTLGTDKLLSTAGGLYNIASVTYPASAKSVVQVPNSWANSGGISYAGPGVLQAPAFAGWGIATFYCRVDTNAVDTTFAIEASEDGGANWYPRVQWTGGLPIDVNMSLLWPMTKGMLLRVTIDNRSTSVKVVNGYPMTLFTLGMIGQITEPP